MKYKGETEYAVYSDDDLVVIGTMKQCSEVTGLKVSTLHTYQKRPSQAKVPDKEKILSGRPKSKWTVVRIEEDE